jgi:hypothetical protein
VSLRSLEEVVLNPLLLCQRHLYPYALSVCPHLLRHFSVQGSQPATSPNGVQDATSSGFGIETGREDGRQGLESNAWT